MREVEVPQPGPGDLLVRVKAAGICHSDAHYRAGRSSVHPLPLTLGHEVAGIVDAIGSEVSGFARGSLRACPPRPNGRLLARTVSNGDATTL